jgi:hypothetical protein
MLSREQKTIRKRFETLIGARLHSFPKERGRLDAPKLRGVYIIYDPRQKVAHVGTTPRGKGGIHQRLTNHLYGQSSFAKKCFKGDGSELRDGFSYRCLPVEDDRLRALLEAYAIGYLCPKHIGLGQAVEA